MLPYNTKNYRMSEHSKSNMCLNLLRTSNQLIGQYSWYNPTLASQANHFLVWWLHRLLFQSKLGKFTWLRAKLYRSPSVSVKWINHHTLAWRSAWRISSNSVIKLNGANSRGTGLLQKPRDHSFSGFVTTHSWWVSCPALSASNNDRLTHHWQTSICKDISVVSCANNSISKLIYSLSIN